MASLFGHETELTEDQISRIKSIAKDDRITALRILQLIEDCHYDLKEKSLSESLQMTRLNYTGDFVREYFLDHQSKHPHKKRMEIIKEVAEYLGISQSAIKKHIYKK